MGYVRLFRRVRLAPGITLNLSGRGPSFSFGVGGAHVTVGRWGVRQTVGIPGTGVFYTAREGWHSGIHTAQPFHDGAPKLHGWRRVAHGVLLGFLGLFAITAVMGIVAAIAGH